MCACVRACVLMPTYLPTNYRYSCRHTYIHTLLISFHPRKQPFAKHTKHTLVKQTCRVACYSSKIYNRRIGLCFCNVHSLCVCRCLFLRVDRCFRACQRVFVCVCHVCVGAQARQHFMRLHACSSSSKPQSACVGNMLWRAIVWRQPNNACRKSMMWSMREALAVVSLIMYLKRIK